MKVLYGYLFKYKGMSLARIAANLCKAGCTVFLSVLLGRVLDGLASTNKNLLISSVVQCVLLIVFFVVVSGVDVAATTVQTKKLLNYIKHDIFSKIINESMEEYRKTHSGKYISILNNDINVIKDEFINNFFELVFQIISFGLSLAVMMRISVAVTGIIIGITVISMLLVSKISDRLMKRQIEFSKSMEDITKLASDIFSGILVIKNYNIVNKMEELYYNSDEIVEENRKKYSVLIGIMNILMVIFGMLTYLIIILYCAHSVMSATLSAGTALIIIQLSSNLTDPINEILSLAGSMSSVKGIGEKIGGLQTKIVEEGDLEVKKATCKQGILIKEVSFGYDKENQNVLSNINIEIQKGRKYAIVGESGSGKSTLIKLLLKYYNKYSGSILLDGEDIRKINTESYCRIVSSLEQDTFIFDDTLWDNICLYSDYEESSVQETIKNAGLDNVVEKLPKGLWTVLGEGGSKLSGGECKRVAFARLLLRKTPILLLDEATSNLDNHTTMQLEKLVLDNEGLTLVSVTHKLIKSILEKYDEIIVLKNGKIIEKGHFEQLMKKKGYFYNLYNIQTAVV